MPDEIIIKPSPATPVAGEPPTPTTNATSTASIGIMLAAAGLLFAFFLPWTTFIGASVSGFDLQKLGEHHRLLWLIPIFSVITLVSGWLSPASQKFAARITGLVPFLVLAYWMSRLGTDVMKIMQGGAYLSLICAAALILIPIGPPKR